MDQLAIQTIENFLSVPLIAPERIHELDAKELASALTRLDDAVSEAKDEAEEAWNKPLDEINLERLDEITILIREAIENCETCRACGDERSCARCISFSRWLATA